MTAYQEFLFELARCASDYYRSASGWNMGDYIYWNHQWHKACGPIVKGSNQL